jgi:chemotaxis protein methyltransferase CheR
MAASVTTDESGAGAVEALEIGLLLEGIRQHYGHDLRGLRPDLVRACVHAMMVRYRLPSVSALQHGVLHEPGICTALLRMLSPPPCSLFDDPEHFRLLRATLVPLLRQSAAPKIWIAECACAEQVNTLAILLSEEGLYERTRIFATAANEALLQEAREGRFAVERLPEYADNYCRSGGRARLSDYVERRDGAAVFSAHLHANVTWAQYSLATDASFNEFQLIICRRAMFAYGISLQRRALQVFDDSMALYGILSVDRGDQFAAMPLALRYEGFGTQPGLYRRIV